MEIFIDGGLFEITILAALAYTINYIFLKKYLLIIFSSISILCPVALIFFRTGEFYYWFVTVSIINSVLLTVLLWKLRQQYTDQPLFDVNKFSRKVYSKLTFRK